jgi:peroxiredoxin
MANLTGEYDVVAEIGMGLLNGILGVVHENQNTSFPTMPHSLSMFLDDQHRGAGDPVPESQRTGVRSRVEVQASTPIVSLPVDTLEVRPEFETSGAVMSRSGPTGGPSPRGVGVVDAGPPVGGVLGGFHPPTRFGFPKLTAQVRVRAWVRDPTEPALPRFVDGDLFVTTGLVRSDVPGGGTFVTLERTFGPSVTFRAAAGTGATDEQQQLIAAIVRNVIRSDTDPQTFRVALPSEVHRFDFKLQPEARRPCVLLMLTLTDRTLGPGAVGSVSAGLLPDGADFAVGVGRDFLVNKLKSELCTGLPTSYHFSKLGVSATIRPDWNHATFDLEPGRIVFSLTGDGDISWWGLDDHFTFTVRQAFSLQVAGGGLGVVPDGDPVVDLHDVAVGGGYLEGKARDKIREERDAALPKSEAQISNALDVGRTLKRILAGINPRPAGVVLTGVEIRSDGVVVPGRIALAASAPIVAAQVARDGFNDALESWIPGGTVDRYLWERFPSHPPDVRVDEHRFVTEWITGRFFGQVCLTVQGTRVAAGGGLTPVSGSACFRFAPVVVQVTELATMAERPLLPLMDPSGDGGARVVGHYDPWAPGRMPRKGHANLLLHFGSEGAEAEAEFLTEALGALRKHDAAVLAVGLTREGGYSRTGSDEGASSRDGRGVRLPDNVLVVEDAAGEWAKAFGVSDPPATVLVGRRGDVVWRDTTALTPTKLARALDKHAEPGGEVEAVPIRVAARLNRRPPDVPLRLEDGSELSLRRLKGRPVALTFWTPRSRPSIDHLELLGEMCRRGGAEAPLVIAVGNGGREPAAEAVRARRLPFPILADADGRISRIFGVWCWPTTIWIRPDQRVEAVDFGTVPQSEGSVGAVGSSARG